MRQEESIGAAGRFIRRVHGIARNNRLGGLIFGQSGDANRDITITSGELEWGRTTYIIPAFDTSGADTFQTYSASGQENATASQWDNANYDNAGTLTAVPNNKFANLFFWYEPDAHLVMVYGRTFFNSQAGAEMEGVPSTSLPSKVSETGILVARFTFQEGVNTAVIFSAFDALFANAGVTAHNDLSTLAWTSAGHTGTANEIAGFDGTGAAAEVDTFSELNTAIADKTLINEEDAITLDSLLTAGANLDVKNGSSTSGSIKFFEDSDDGTNSTEIKGVATAANLSWILPATNGTAGQVLEIASVSSNEITLEWDDDGGSAGGGSTTFSLFPYSGKLTGSYVTATIANLDAAVSARIDAGEGPWGVLFDADTDQAAVFYGIIPSTYSSTPVINLIASYASATTDQAEWECAIQCTTPGDAEDISTETFAAGATAVITVPGTAGHTGALISITPTDDSCAPGDIMYVYISTDADDATNDDATGDRELRGAYGSFTQ